MGLVKLTALLGRTEHELTEVEFVVDTGSFYTAIDSELRDRLGLREGTPMRKQLADGSVVPAELTSAYLKIDGREGGVPVEVAPVPVSLLGVSALEALGMKVNPVTQELEVVHPFTAPPTLTRFANPPNDA
jgi:predicted aspartyl protease